jgi:CheY-like chemotaxis protein
MRYSECSVLVVDDSDANREILAHRLEKIGYQTGSARNGVEALDVLALERFDMVLLDMMMPELDGFGTLERMKANPALRDIPVIMVTAVSDAETVMRCIKMGAEDYIVKPLNMPLVQTRIWRCLTKVVLRNRVTGDAKSAGDITGARLLVIDDVAMNRDVLARRLTHHNCAVLTAESAAAAWPVLEREPVDLILLDLMMPDVDGFEVLRRLKADAVLAPIPVIILSAEDNSGSMAKALELGAADYMVKPFHAPLLKSRIESCLAEARMKQADSFT